jgi:hypothetical protein
MYRVAGTAQVGIYFPVPNALTMLKHYQSHLAASRGAGLTGVAEQARLTGTIRALIEVVDDDFDPRKVR